MAQLRQRSATESLLAIVLGLEAALVIFATLAVFGLRVLPPPVTFAAGGGLILVLALSSWLQRYRWGPWLGWLMQAVIIASGAIVTLMFIIGGGFAAIYAYCFFRGRAIDRAKAEMMAASPEKPGARKQ